MLGCCKQGSDCAATSAERYHSPSSPSRESPPSAVPARWASRMRRVARRTQKPSLAREAIRARPLRARKGDDAELQTSYAECAACVIVIRVAIHASASGACPRRNQRQRPGLRASHCVMQRAILRAAAHAAGRPRGDHARPRGFASAATPSALSGIARPLSTKVAASAIPQSNVAPAAMTSRCT